MQIKLDELIRALNGAHNALLDLEESYDKTLDQFRATYEKLAARAKKTLDFDHFDPEIKNSGDAKVAEQAEPLNPSAADRLGR